MDEHRPIKGVKNLIKDGIQKLSKTEYRFLKLMKDLKTPISEEKILNFYIQNVQQYTGIHELIKGKWIVRKYTEQETKRMSLSWFDRNLGAMIRKQILSDKGNSVLNDLMRLN